MPYPVRNILTVRPMAAEEKIMKVVINKCFGGFGLSEAAYERLIELGVPVRACVEQQRDPETLLFLPEPANDGEVIFDRTLSNGKFSDEQHIKVLGRYWETWIDSDRSNPLLLQVVEELGDKANGNHAKLEIVEIPDDVEYEISEYDGREHVAEVHRTWG